ncbi:hypothetical protein GLV89_15195 [Halomonas alkaliantarctica]|nr:hypothetical protein [Halomonas alkaliantarctica]
MFGDNQDDRRTRYLSLNTKGLDRPRDGHRHDDSGGRLVFGIFAALSELERELMSERTKAGLISARARGRNGGCPIKLRPPKFDWPWQR